MDSATGYRGTCFGLGLLAISILAIPTTRIARAADGDPITIRNHGQGKLTVETFWGVNMTFDNDVREQSTEASEKWSVAGYFDWHPDAIQSKQVAKPGPVFWEANVEKRFLTKHAMKVSNARNMTLLEADGTRILVLHTNDAKPSAIPSVPKVDAILAPKDVQFQDQWVATVNPRHLILWSNTVTDQAIQTPSNVYAISKANTPSEKTTTAILAPQKAKLTTEIEQLLAAKEKENEATAKLFEKLNASQMNWAPPNGTHTPRWNAEHMMGRELLFFSQIYHEKNAEIPVMNRNPRQMPKDYTAARPDWNGAEEARQIRRVAKFTRDYAFLLVDLPMDRRASGSAWSPRGLLKQMERHYRDHTGKTEKKFELPEWPKQ